MTSAIDRDPPDTWGNDPLTNFLDNVRINQFATFARMRSEVIDLTTIDGMFVKLFDGAINLRPTFPAEFLLRAHAAYRAACGLIMAGQIFEAQAMLRLCLEHGGYAFYIGGDQALWEFWMSRHDSDAANDAVRKKFSNRKIIRHLSDANADLGKAFSTLYEWTIDYGAHPNERGFSLNTMLEVLEDGSQKTTAIYLHRNGFLMDFGLRNTAQVGICCLRIAQDIYPSRTRLLGIQHTVGIMSKRF